MCVSMDPLAQKLPSWKHKLHNFVNIHSEVTFWAQTDQWGQQWMGMASSPFSPQLSINPEVRQKRPHGQKSPWRFHSALMQYRTSGKTEKNHEQSLPLRTYIVKLYLQHYSSKSGQLFFHGLTQVAHPGVCSCPVMPHRLEKSPRRIPNNMHVVQLCSSPTLLLSHNQPLLGWSPCLANARRNRS